MKDREIIEEDVLDHELLGRFARGRDAGAFERLLRRHGGWVYALARRQIQDGHLAEDITQAVFLLLAQKAAKMRSDRALAAWLYSATCYAVRAARRRDRQRVQQERVAGQAAEKLRDTREEGGDVISAGDWEELGPRLDLALAGLGSLEREAILLRYYQDLPLKKVGAVLEMSEEAARKRVARGLEKLRVRLGATGFSEGALGAAIVGASGQGMPEGLLMLTSKVAAGKVAVSGSVTTLMKGASKMFMLAKAKLLGWVMAGVVIVGMTGIMIKVLAEPPGVVVPPDLDGAVAATIPVGGIDQATTTTAAATQGVVPDEQANEKLIEFLILQNEQTLEKLKKQAITFTVRAERNTPKPANALFPTKVIIEGSEKMMGEHWWSDYQYDPQYADGKMPPPIKLDNADGRASFMKAVSKHEERRVRNDQYFAMWAVGTGSVQLWELEGLVNQSEDNKQMVRHSPVGQIWSFGFGSKGTGLREIQAIHTKWGVIWVAHPPSSATAPYRIEAWGRAPEKQRFGRYEIVIDPHQGFMITEMRSYDLKGRLTSETKVEPQNVGGIWLAAQVAEDRFDPATKIPSETWREQISEVVLHDTLPPETFDFAALDVPEGMVVVGQNEDKENRPQFFRKGKLISSEEELKFLLQAKKQKLSGEDGGK